VIPVHAEHPDDWNSFARLWVQSAELPEELIVMAGCPSQLTPQTNPHLEIIDLRCGGEVVGVDETMIPSP
jgi:hypothetical protein